MALSPFDMLDKLKDAKEGDLLFVSYIAGRPPKPRAIAEAHRCIVQMGMARRHCFGKIHRVWTTKRGDPVLTVFADTRDTIHADGTRTEGAYRCFNPALGELLHLEVI